MSEDRALEAGSVGWRAFRVCAPAARARYRRGMGFLDKAKKLAEQAQTKLDEVQTQINQQGSPRPGGQQAGGHVEYDNHGRPLPPQQPPGGPVQSDPTAPPAPGSADWTPPPSTPGVPPTEPPSGPPAPIEGSAPPPQVPGVPSGPPQPPAEGEGKAHAVPGVPGVEEDRNRPSYAPPKLTSGDPLAG